MSLVGNLLLLVTRIGTEFKTVKTSIAAKADAVHTHVATTDLTATGTKSSATFLRGDNTWAALAASNSVTDLNVTTDYTTTKPAVPGTGTSVFSKFKARRLLAFQGPSGLDVSVQPSLFSNRVARWGAVSNSATPVLDNLAVTNVAAPTAVAQATTNFFTSMVRARFSTTAVAANGAGMRTANAQWFLSNTANMGGFFFVCRVGLSAITATNRIFIGLSTTTAALAPATNPSALLNLIGFGADSTDTTQMFFMTNDGSGTATRTALGVAFAPQAAATNFYEFHLFSPSGSASTVYWSAERLSDGTFIQGSAVADLPAISTLMAAHVHYSNGTTAAIGSIDVQSLYIESDN